MQNARKKCCYAKQEQGDLNMKCIVFAAVIHGQQSKVLKGEGRRNCIDLDGDELVNFCHLKTFCHNFKNTAIPSFL